MEIRNTTASTQAIEPTYQTTTYKTTTTGTMNARIDGEPWDSVLRNYLNDCMVRQDFVPVKREEPEWLKDFPAISDIAVYNDKVVKVTFADGTFTKCVCDDENTFDVYTGIAFCLFKRMLGKDGHKKFNQIMRYAMKRDTEIWERRAEDARKAMEAREKAAKAAEKRAAKQAKKRQEQIDIQREAVLGALKVYKGIYTGGK